MSKNTKFLTVAMLVIAIAGSYYFPKVQTQVQNVFSGSSGTTHSFLESFDSGLGVGGVYATSTSGSAMPLLASSIENVSTINAVLNVQDATITFPASSTISFMRNVGDSRIYWVKNATTTAAMDLTIAAGTGLNLKSATTTEILVGDTDGGNAARVTLVRQNNLNISMYVQLFVEP